MFFGLIFKPWALLFGTSWELVWAFVLGFFLANPNFPEDKAFRYKETISSDGVLVFQGNRKKQGTCMFLKKQKHLFYYR